MSEIEPEKLDRTDSRFARVIVAAKRARQIKDGARNLVPTRSANPLTLALDEMAAGEILPMHVEEPELLPKSIAPTPVIGGLLSTSVDDDDLELPVGLGEGVGFGEREEDDEAEVEDDPLAGAMLDDDHAITPPLDDIGEHEPEGIGDDLDEEDEDEDEMSAGDDGSTPDDL